jgi:hypothetical protein
LKQVPARALQLGKRANSSNRPITHRLDYGCPPIATPLKSLTKTFAADHHPIALVANDTSDIGNRTDFESHAIHSRLATSSPLETTVSRTLGNASEAAQAGVKRKVDAVGRALVDHVEVQAGGVDGVVGGGEVVAVGDVDALVLCAEAVHDVVGRGFLDGCSSAVAIQRAELEAWAELVCGGDARGFDLADG